MGKLKLSARQQRVVDLMRAGWHLGMASSSRNSRSWLQRDGFERGGPIEDVHTSTFYSLYERGIIRKAHKDWFRAEYVLTDEDDWKT